MDLDLLTMSTASGPTSIMCQRVPVLVQGCGDIAEAKIILPGFFFLLIIIFSSNNKGDWNLVFPRILSPGQESDLLGHTHGSASSSSQQRPMQMF